MIEIKNLSYSIGLRTLLDNANLFVGRGQKVGIIGLNGCGKTTLFNLILGNITPEGGEINIPSDLRVATVKQEIENTDATLIDFILNSDIRIDALQKELSKTTDGHRIAEIHDALNSLGIHSAEARAAAILNGLGFKNEDFSRTLKEFSGGWRMRASLASTLFAPSDILLLDEPTNHLDLETTIWLENHLSKMPQTLLIISHDRNILNKLCERIAFMDDSKITLYTGDYDTFERTRAIEKENAEAAAKQHELRREHLQSFVDRFRYTASKARQAQSRIKMIERMGDKPPVPVDAEVEFHFPQPEQLPPYLINIEDGVAGYSMNAAPYTDTVVLKNLNLTVSQDDRIAMLGSNGNGKSTLAKVLADRLKLLSGKTKKSRKLRTAYFAQHQTEELPLDSTGFNVMSDAMGYLTPMTKVYNHLGGFGLNRNKADTKIAKLSGGEKARLMLALITKDKPHLLILDEPTNHLDIASRSALLDALNKYEGAVILITHDLHMIELVCDRLWLVAGGGVSYFSGDVEEYKQKVINGTIDFSVNANVDLQNQENNRAEQRKLDAQKRLELAPLKKEIRALERSITQMQEERGILEEELIKNFNQMKSKELAYKIKDIEQAEEKWLELSNKLEEISK